MVTFDDFKRRHIQYLARAEGLGKKVGTNRALLMEIRQFINELAMFLRENKKTLTTIQRAELTLYRDRWIEMTQAYR